MVSPRRRHTIVQTQRDLQKVHTRHRLHRAGKLLFADGGYLTCRVDEIASAAGISRAAFYLHFKNKRALLTDILDRELMWEVRRYRNLPASPGEAEIISWIDGFVEGYHRGQKSLSLFSFAFAVDDRFSALAASHRYRAISLLGKRVPAFRLIDSAGKLDTERHLALTLLMIAMTEFCSNAAKGVWPHDKKLTTTYLARRFLEFVHA